MKRIKEISYSEKICIRSKVQEVYRQLRKEGFICRSNFLCCSNCAGYNLCTKIEELIKSGKKKKDQIKGIVYWTKIDDNHLMHSNDGLWLSYGNVECKDYR